MTKILAGDLANYGIDRFLVFSGGADNVELLYYLILVGVYLLVTIPLIYLILAKLKKLTFLKWGLVIVATVFSILIFVEGNKTRFEAPFYYYARVVEVSSSSEEESNQVREWVFAQFTSPYNGSFDVRFQPCYSVKIAVEDTNGSVQFVNYVGDSSNSYESDQGVDNIFENRESISSIGKMFGSQSSHYLYIPPENPNLLSCHRVHPFEKHFLMLSTKQEDLTTEKSEELSSIRREELFRVVISGDSWYLEDPYGDEKKSKDYPVNEASFEELPELMNQMGYQAYGEAYRQLLSRYVRGHAGDMTVTFCQEPDVQFSTQSNSKYFGYTMLVDWKENAS